LVEFRPRARLLKLIGAELISDEVVAVTELVKNAHDADASGVSIEFRGVASSDGCITIRDDGHGMDLDSLLGHWMEPAGTSKSRNGVRLTKRGRRVLGEKGVGRFAADKLARVLELVSRRSGDAHEMRAVFDWDDFDTDTRMLSDIKNRWEIRRATELPHQGTVLRMTGPRTVWNERMFRRLCTRLARLRSPFTRLDSFAIRMESDEFPQYSGELRSDILQRAPYRIDAVFDGKETIEFTLNDSCRSIKHPWNGHGDLRCGPVQVRLFAFDLETESVARIGPRMEVRAWLKEWSGISVYRDAFRVWPYGEPHDDWLRLDQRRVNNPVVRLSNNQVVGFVEITNDGNPELIDQTNREGLLQSRAFDDLRRLMYFVLQTLESERQCLRHPTVEPRRQLKEQKDVTEELTAAAELYRLARSAPPELASPLRRLAMKLKDTGAREKAQQRLFTEGYSELAAVGQAATGLTVSVQPVLENMRNHLANIRGAAGSRADRALSGSLRALEEAIKLLATRISLMSSIEEGGNYHRRAIDIHTELESFRELVAPLLAPRKIALLVDSIQRSVLRAEMRPESFHRILHILMNNSLEWLYGVRNPEIRIKATAHRDYCDLVFSDNGPGIASELAARVFEPLYSGREGGRGMGLTIARNIVISHGGQIEVITDRRRRGANIRVMLPRKRSRATMHAN
jgi:signal transduction histidine kinase